MVIRSNNHCFDRVDIPINMQGATSGQIIIGNDVWLAANVVILPNVEIGDGAIVGAGSIVTKNVDPYTIVCGNPAKYISKRI